jgi:hypothetical protein
MRNAEITEIREFGTGLRDHLELHGVRMDARADPLSNLDLFELCAVVVQSPAQGALTLQPVTVRSVGLLAA